MQQRPNGARDLVSIKAAAALAGRSPGWVRHRLNQLEPYEAPQFLPDGRRGVPVWLLREEMERDRRAAAYRDKARVTPRRPHLKLVVDNTK